MKKSQTMQSSELVLPVPVSQKVLDAFGGDMGKIRDIAANLMNKLADGGLMLGPLSAGRLREIGLESEEAIVKAAEKGIGRSPAKYHYEVVIDRAFVPAIERIAKMLGLSVDAVLSDAINYGLAQGWVYHMNKDWIVVRLTPDQVKTITRIIGIKESELDGEAITTYLEKMMASAR